MPRPRSASLHQPFIAYSTMADGVGHARFSLVSRYVAAFDPVTRIKADTNLDEAPPAVSNVLSEPLHGFLHPERSATSPHRVVLVCYGRAKKSHDPVAHNLVDCALVVVDRFHHVPEKQDRGACVPPRDPGWQAPLKSAKSTVTCFRSPFWRRSLACEDAICYKLQSETAFLS